MAANPADLSLDQRLAAVEAQLRGDPGIDPVSVDALPLARILQAFEATGNLDAKQALTPASVRATEIGVLPAVRLELNGVGAAIPINVGTRIGWDTLKFDTDQMATQPVLGAWPSFTVRTGGVYNITCGVHMDYIAAAGADANCILWIIRQTPTAGVPFLEIATDRRVRWITNGDMYLLASCQEMLGVGDVISASVYQNRAAPFLNIGNATEPTMPGAWDFAGAIPQHTFLSASWAGQGTFK